MTSKVRKDWSGGREMTKYKNSLKQKDEEGIELAIREKRVQRGQPSKGHGEH